jgi:hypothetical protein
MRANISAFENLIVNQKDKFLSEISVFNSIFDIIQLAKKLTTELDYYEEEPGSTKEVKKRIHDQMNNALEKEVELRMRNDPPAEDDYGAYMKIKSKVHAEALINPIVSSLMERTFYDPYDLHKLFGEGPEFDVVDFEESQPDTGIVNPYSEMRKSLKSEQIKSMASNIVVDIQPQIRNIVDQLNKEGDLLFDKYDEDEAGSLFVEKMDIAYEKASDIVRKAFTEKDWLPEQVRESVYEQLKNRDNNLLSTLGVMVFDDFKDMYI